MSDCEGPACKIPKAEGVCVGYKHMRGQLLRDMETRRQAHKLSKSEYMKICEEWTRMYGDIDA